MTLSETNKLAKHIIRLLKVSEVQFPVAKTAKGIFSLTFNENEGFEMMLDSVPLSTKNVLTDENNIELKRMVEKYLFEQETLKFNGMPIIPDENIPKGIIITPEEKAVLEKVIAPHVPVSKDSGYNTESFDKFAEENPAYVDEVKTSQDYPELHKAVKKIAKKQASKKK